MSAAERWERRHLAGEDGYEGNHFARSQPAATLAMMDWQQIIALSIVAAAAALLLRGRLRKRKKFSFERDTHCGCSSPTGPKQTIIFHARKGEQPRTIVKMK